MHRKFTPSHEKWIIRCIYLFAGLYVVGKLSLRSLAPQLFMSSEEASRNAIAELNIIRAQYNRSPLEHDPRLYHLALARVMDMIYENYYDHTNPKTGECPDNMKTEYGLAPEEYAAENALDYGDDGLTPSFMRPPSQAISLWLDSRGHRYNLLYSEHTAGAMACYFNKCVFLGLNTERMGEGCHTAEEGHRYWNSTPKKADEV